MATRTVQEKTTTVTRLDTNIVANITLTDAAPVATGFEKSSTKSAGLYKAANMFYKTLYTDKDSNPLNTQEGTYLLTLFQSNITDRDVLYAFVDEQVADAFSQVQDYQDVANATDEELLISAAIVDFSFSEEGPTLDFSVDLHNAAGESVTLQIPSIVLV